jgi:DNA-binding MarR family transcriptional regulator
MQHAKKLLEDNISDIPLGLFVSIIHRTRIIHLNNQMKDLELTAGQVPFLLHLSHKEGINQDDLAIHLHIDKGTVARALKKLEDNGFIYREVNPENRRRYLLFLTEKGREAVPLIHNIDKEWEDSVCSNFSDDECDRLFGILQTLAMKSLEKVHKNGEKQK